MLECSTSGNRSRTSSARESWPARGAPPQWPRRPQEPLPPLSRGRRQRSSTPGASAVAPAPRRERIRARREPTYRLRKVTERSETPATVVQDDRDPDDSASGLRAGVSLGSGSTRGTCTSGARTSDGCHHPGSSDVLQPWPRGREHGRPAPHGRTVKVSGGYG